MGKRYGSLPSELLKKADTFDLMIMDVALTYEQYIHDKENKSVNPGMYDQADIEKRFKEIRNGNENK